MITNREHSKQLLMEKGIKPTLQRLKILESMERLGEHPTAEMIFKELVKEIPTMSRTTIYNTLRSFQDKGIIIPVMITGTEIRYDMNLSCHHHLLCEKCGRIVDVAVECPNIHKTHIHGHQIKELHGYLRGVCVQCLAGKKS